MTCGIQKNYGKPEIEQVCKLLLGPWAQQGLQEGREHSLTQVSKDVN